MKSNIDKIKESINSIALEKDVIAQEVTIIAATKTVSVDKINELYASGISIAAENRVQEFLTKYDYVKNIKWHFIGALQTNKVKYIIDKVELIHSVDRVSLIDEIDRCAKKINKVQNVLLQINAGYEESKSGVYAEDLDDLYKYALTKSNLVVVGFMPVLPIVVQESLYKEMYAIYKGYKDRDENVKILSMGMSGDYLTAIKNGANLVRLGSILFGERQI